MKVTLDIRSVVLGLVVGILFATAIPASAHHADYSQSSSIYSLQSKISSLESKVRTLEYKTSKLNSLGTYTGTISGNSISPSFLCGYGDIAVWSFSSLSC